MTLRKTIETVMRVEYNDLEKLISETYGIDYEIVPMEEWNNDSEHSYSIKKEELSKYDQAYLQDFKNGKPRHFILPSIMTDLCNRDIIPEGNYLIGVCW